MSSCHQNDLQVTLLPASGLPMKRVLFLQLTENLAGTWTNAKMFLCHKAGWKHAILTPMLFALSRYWMQTNTNYTTDIYLVMEVFLGPSIIGDHWKLFHFQENVFGSFLRHEGQHPVHGLWREPQAFDHGRQRSPYQDLEGQLHPIEELQYEAKNFTT